MNGKKKKIYAAVLGFAALGLILDQLVLKSAPESATANPQSIDVTTSVGNTPQALMISVTAAPFPRSGLDHWPETPVRDPFAMTGEIESAMSGLANNGSRSRVRATEATGIEGFIQAHQLGGVMTGDGAPIAVVDGVLLNIGDFLDDCELVIVRAMAVEFSCPEGPAILSVPGLEHQVRK